MIPSDLPKILWLTGVLRLAFGYSEVALASHQSSVLDAVVSRDCPVSEVLALTRTEEKSWATVGDWLKRGVREGDGPYRQAYLDALAQIKLSDDTRNARPLNHVVVPVDGLYESIPTEAIELGNGIATVFTQFPTDNGGKSHMTQLYSADKRKLGTVIRIVTSDRSEIRFKAIDLTENRVDGTTEVPSFVAPAGTVALVPGRGIPTQAYLTLQQMRRAGVPYGGLKTAIAMDINHSQTQIEILASPEARSWFRRHPGKPLPAEIMAKAIPETHTYAYLSTVLTQSGHQISGISVKPGYHRPLEEQLSLDRVSKSGSLISPLLIESRLSTGEWVPFPPETLVPSSFEIHFQLRPYSNEAAASVQ